MLLSSIFVFILGLCVGSFLNCLIYRLEKEEKLSGRSYCPNCSHILNWPDLVPVFSFLFLKGKCRYCHKKISIQYPSVETSTAIIFLLIFNYKLSNFEFSIFYFLFSIFLFYIASSLIIIFVYDLKHFEVPDKVLFPAIKIAFLYRLFENLINWSLVNNWSLRIDNFILLNYLLASAIASGFFLTIYLTSKGNWIGFGDVKLAILLGLILGLPHILVALFLSFFFGAIIGLGLVLFKKRGLKSQIPFAPFLITGTLVSLFWGQEMIDWYRGLLLY